MEVKGGTPSAKKGHDIVKKGASHRQKGGTALSNRGHGIVK